MTSNVQVEPKTGVFSDQQCAGGTEDGCVLFQVSSGCQGTPARAPCAVPTSTAPTLLFDSDHTLS